MFQPQATPYAASFSSYGGLNDGGSAGFGYQSHGLNLDNGSGSLLFANPTFKPVGSATASNLRPLTSRPLRQHHNMAAMDNMGDMAAQQAAAGQYQSDVKGPLVGNRKSSHAITAEYAKADPVYVAKTSNLPQTYSYYRPVLGDGNCGWRAIVYSYFETLQKLGNQDRVENELARMLSLSPWITSMTGHDEWIWEDMRDEVLRLLKDISDSISLGPQPDSVSVVLQRLNDTDVSDSMMYWFRLLASSWLKAYPDRYQGFIPEDMGVDGYRANVLEPPNSEIDHLGMSLLIDVLLKPVGMAVEVVYLDLSEGTTVNVHRFQELDANDLPMSPEGPIIYLLYRPGHYDILYKDDMLALGARQQQILDDALANPNIQVNRVGSFSHHHELQPTPMSHGGSMSSDDLMLMLSIPGFSMANPHHGFPKYTTDYDPIPSESYALEHRGSISVSPISPISPMAATSMFPTSGLPIHSIPPTYHSSSTSKSSTSTLGTNQNHNDIAVDPSPSVQIRRSRFELEADWKDTPAPTCQTATFKNSPFNTAHYNNPHFQPEEYVPDREDFVSTKSMRKREGSSRSN